MFEAYIYCAVVLWVCCHVEVLRTTCTNSTASLQGPKFSLPRARDIHRENLLSLTVRYPAPAISDADEPNVEVADKIRRTSCSAISKFHRILKRCHRFDYSASLLSEEQLIPSPSTRHHLRPLREPCRLRSLQSITSSCMLLIAMTRKPCLVVYRFVPLTSRTPKGTRKAGF
jgi:hypothetical protein